MADRSSVSVIMRMLVAVVVAAMVVMNVIMRTMIVMAVVVVRVIMRGGGCFGIGPAFGIERRVDFDQLRTEPLQHLFDDMVAANA